MDEVKVEEKPKSDLNSLENAISHTLDHVRQTKGRLINVIDKVKDNTSEEKERASSVEEKPKNKISRAEIEVNKIDGEINQIDDYLSELEGMFG